MADSVTDFVTDCVSDFCGGFSFESVGNQAIIPVHTEEIVKDQSQKTGKDCEFLSIISLEDLTQIQSRFHGVYLSLACSLLQLFLCEPGFCYAPGGNFKEKWIYFQPQRSFAPFLGRKGIIYHVTAYDPEIEESVGNLYIGCHGNGFL